MSDDQTTLICARADHPLTVAGSVFLYDCSVCGQRVMTAPSGQRFLEEHPGAPIICHVCYLKRQERPDDKISLAPGAEDELRTVEPNLWRVRN